LRPLQKAARPAEAGIQLALHTVPRKERTAATRAQAHRAGNQVSADLLSLAQRLVDLDRETAEVRSAMRKLLTNGSDPNPSRSTRSGPKPGSNHPARAKAATA
jgi:hypothetical protein